MTSNVVSINSDFNGEPTDLLAFKEFIDKRFVFYAPTDSWISKAGDAWDLKCLMTSRAAVQYLMGHRLSQEEAKVFINNGMYLTVYGFERTPAEPEFIHRGDRTYINLWTPPRLTAKEGNFDTISEVINSLCNDDKEGVRWLTHWIAFKIQHPEVLPKVAVLFAGTPGTGKGTIAHVMREMLGWENTATIGQNDLESRFASSWMDKLFVLGDEVLTSEHRKDVSNILKNYIDSAHLSVEEKFHPRREVENRIAWMFASNQRVTPLVVESKDRRYTVFNNYTNVTDEWKMKLARLFDPIKRGKPTKEFDAEIQAFLFYLQNIKVDTAFIRVPYENQARRELILSSMNSQELFIEEIREGKANKWLTQTERTLDFNDPVSGTWDRPEGVSVSYLYKTYETFCRKTGGTKVREKNFLTVVSTAASEWPITVIAGEEYIKIPR